MQGRFSPIKKGKIQEFPRDNWRGEFAIAVKNGFALMEWVVEQVRLEDNPLMTRSGRMEIKNLCSEHGLGIPSVTCDNFIQEPFYKAAGDRRRKLLDDFRDIVISCGETGIKKIVVPLVDKGSIENRVQEEQLQRGLEYVSEALSNSGCMIAFESDLKPMELGKFIKTMDERLFGINYDIGNSASLGYDHEEELKEYANRIINVHVKDRKLGGTTVPLGQGDADLPEVLRALEGYGYDGNYILQTARSQEGDDEKTLCMYRDMTAGWLGYKAEVLNER